MDVLRPLDFAHSFELVIPVVTGNRDSFSEESEIFAVKDLNNSNAVESGIWRDHFSWEFGYWYDLHGDRISPEPNTGYTIKVVMAEREISYWVKKDGG